MKRTNMVMDWAAEFTCPGGDCGLTCCTEAWEISLMDQEIKMYQEMENEYKNVILDAIDLEKKKMQCVNGHCKLLDKEGYCDIVKYCGEEYLSYTCSIFPRKSQIIGDVQEIGVEILCPEVAKRLLDHEPIEWYVAEEETDEEFAQVDFLIYNNLYQARRALLEILQYKSGEYVYGKTFILFRVFEQIVSSMQGDEMTADTVQNILNDYRGQDIIDELFHACEVISEKKEAQYATVYKALKELIFGDLWLRLAIYMKQFFPELEKIIMSWVENEKEMQQDLDAFIHYKKSQMPYLTERYWAYVLFINWYETQPKQFEDKFISRVVELFFINIWLMALYKKNGNLEEKEICKLIAVVDRVIARVKPSVLDEINSVFRSQREEQLTNLLLLME